MKIEIGSNPHESFRILADDGTDLTSLLKVRSVEIRADAEKLTMAKLEIFADSVDVVVDGVHVTASPLDVGRLTSEVVAFDKALMALEARLAHIEGYLVVE